jgi:hypothetical protein
MVGVGIQARTGYECIELTQVFAVEENDGWAMDRNGPSLCDGARRASAKQQEQGADLLVLRLNNRGG